MESLGLKAEDALSRAKWKRAIQNHSGDPRRWEKPGKESFLVTLVVVQNVLGLAVHVYILFTEYAYTFRVLHLASRQYEHARSTARHVSNSIANVINCSTPITQARATNLHELPSFRCRL